MRLPRALVAASVLIGLLFSPSEIRAAEALRPLVFRVFAPDAASTARLFATGVDVLEARRGNELLVAGDEKTTDRLRAAGFLVTVDEELSAGMLSPDAFAGGYRTVVEHEQHLQSIATSRPDLATLVDFGDTWRKLQGRPGFDLLALCLTKKTAGDCALSPTSAKPRFLLMGAIHARELTTAELVWRFADHLVAGYGTDAEVTSLLDSTEIWLVPVFNADGRAIVEQGGSSPYLQRKNGNDTLGTCSNPPSSSNQHGIDLNRNASYGWGGLGTSTSPCSATYRGTAAASEPEEQAIEALLRQLFPDQRGPAPGDAAPLSAKGVFLSLHSYSNLVLLPWGDLECNLSPCPPALQAPNDAGLRSLAFRLSAFNGYETGQASELLYAASGATDDFAYADLGIAGYTFEVGPQSGSCSGFTPAYSCQDGTFWPLNKGAFLYAAKAARAPYALSLGPTTSIPTFTPATAPRGTPVSVRFTTNDGSYGQNGVARPAIQTIAAAEIFVDVPPWAGGTPLPATAVDGAFDTASEQAAVTLPTTALAEGRHMVYARGRDADGNHGPVTAAFLTVDPPPAPPVVNGVSPVCASTTGGRTITISGSGFAAGATVTIAGTPALVTNVTATSVTATAGSRIAGPSVAGDVVVTNPGNLSGTLPAAFAYALRGDANDTGAVTGGDAFFLNLYVFLGGAAPHTLCNGDANGNGAITAADSFFLNLYVFLGGAVPGP